MKLPVFRIGDFEGHGDFSSLIDDEPARIEKSMEVDPQDHPIAGIAGTAAGMGVQVGGVEDVRHLAPADGASQAITIHDPTAEIPLIRTAITFHPLSDPNFTLRGRQVA